MYHAYWYARTYPQVDPTTFSESATSMEQLMKEASIILHRLSESKGFAAEVMTAAQQGQKEKVEQLIKSTGIHAGVKVDYTPDGLSLHMSSEVSGQECCHLTITLRWG